MRPEEVERGVYLHPEDQPYREGTHPESASALAAREYKRDVRSAIEQGRLAGWDRRDLRVPPDCLGLTLNSDDILAAAAARETVVGKTDAHPIAQWIYDFWLLEIVTRIPYLAFGSALIGLELVEMWRNVGLRQLHAAEEWNEDYARLGSSRIFTSPHLPAHPEHPEWQRRPEPSAQELAEADARRRAST
ncbi:hypothetical protein T492DRAFT_1130590 [Pavlovales sp. CCMP2436]|nr:hypothetical protein T492DRAFT_1130590 [Pavlovales sp. CCMP2436]